MYDRLSYGLVDMIKKYPKEFQESEYTDIFKFFDGTTGFDLVDKLLPSQLEIIKSIANMLTRTNKRIIKK